MKGGGGGKSLGRAGRGRRVTRSTGQGVHFCLSGEGVTRLDEYPCVHIQDPGGGNRWTGVLTRAHLSIPIISNHRIQAKQVSDERNIENTN